MPPRVYAYTSTQQSCCVDNLPCEPVRGREDPTGKNSCCFTTLRLAFLPQPAVLVSESNYVEQNFFSLMEIGGNDWQPVNQLQSLEVTVVSCTFLDKKRRLLFL